MSTLSRKIIVGCGYLGERVAQAWQAAGHEIVAVTRQAERAALFAARGWQPVIADVTQPATLRALPPADALLWSVGFDRRAANSMHDVYVAGLSHLLDHLPAGVQKIVYISSTGVYGDAGGAWVDEGTPCRPDREGGRLCWAAEQLLTSHPRSRQALILRMAGLYGPGRLPSQADLLARRVPRGAGTGYLNLVHIEDAAQVVVCAEQHARLPNLFIVSDGHPVLRSDYYRELARLLGLDGAACDAPAPSTAWPTGSDGTGVAGQPLRGTRQASRSSNSKRLRIDKLRAELPVQFRYASYREGLSAVLAGPNG